MRKKQAKIRALDALAKLTADTETNKKTPTTSSPSNAAMSSSNKETPRMDKEGGELIAQLRRRKGESAESLVTNTFLNRLFNTKATEKDAHDLILRMEDLLDLIDTDHTGYVDWDTFTRYTHTPHTPLTHPFVHIYIHMITRKHNHLVCGYHHTFLQPTIL